MFLLRLQPGPMLNCNFEKVAALAAKRSRRIALHMRTA